MKCKHCNKNYVKYKGGMKGYQNYCSLKCSNNSETVKKNKIISYQKKYGVDNPFQSEEIKQKIKQINLELYNVEHPIKSEKIKKKMRETILNKYGVEHYSKTNEYKKKYIKTCQEIYGVVNPFQAEFVKNKIKETCKKRYGVEHIMYLDETKKKLRKIFMIKYGVPWSTYLMRGKYSKISQELFWNIYNRLDFHLQNKIYFAELNREFAKYFKDIKQGYFYDFVIPSLKICIEFNGDIWHANPKIYNENDRPNPYTNVTAKEIWNYDELKIKKLKKEGYLFLIIWESDYNKNKEAETNKCIEFIKNNL